MLLPLLPRGAFCWQFLKGCRLRSGQFGAFTRTTTHLRTCSVWKIKDEFRLVWNAVLANEVITQPKTLKNRAIDRWNDQWRNLYDHPLLSSQISVTYFQMAHQCDGCLPPLKSRTPQPKLNNTFCAFTTRVTKAIKATKLTSNKIKLKTLKLYGS